MAGLTGLEALDVILLFLSGLSLFVILGAVRRSVPGTRRAGVAAVPAVAGAVALALLLIRHGLPPLGDLVAGAPAAALAVGIVFVVVAVGEFLLVRLPSGILGLVRRRAERGGVADLVMVMTVALPLGVGMAALEYIDRTVAAGEVVGARHELPGLPMDVVMTEELGGYISLAEGSILRFRLPEPDGDLELETVADGLGFLRGMAMVDGTVFVGEIVDLPCDPPVPECKGYQVDESPAAGERTILTSARGRILAFDVADGRLEEPRVLLDELPVVNTEHGVNGMVVGPDGFLYVSIGHVEILWESPDVVDQIDVPNADLLGTIIRVDPRSGEAGVFARGVRNVYGLAFDEAGRLFGVDNDGPTPRGWRAEELLEIVEGLDYGYPVEGTYGTPEARTGFPIWSLDTTGTAGVTWDHHEQFGPRLLVGGTGRLVQVRLTDYEAGTLGSRTDVTQVGTLPGFITAIEVLPGERILATVFEWERRSALYILEDPLGPSP